MLVELQNTGSKIVNLMTFQDGSYAELVQSPTRRKPLSTAKKNQQCILVLEYTIDCSIQHFLK